MVLPIQPIPNIINCTVSDELKIAKIILFHKIKRGIEQTFVIIDLFY